jgi:hypothetical protein
VTVEADLAAAIAAAPVPPRFWWRDDDAGADDARLLPLLDVARARSAPLALAMVPAWLDARCVERALAAAEVTVLQHGIAHADHAAPPAKKIELGGAAPRDRIRAGLGRGRTKLAEAFGARFVPALVPPWNRIAPDLLPGLAELGFIGISTYGPRSAAIDAGLTRVNTHLDLVVWREEGRHLDFAEAVARLAALVIANRSGEPIGILSHHQVMDAGAFSVLDRLLALVQDQPRATLAAAGPLFGEGR